MPKTNNWQAKQAQKQQQLAQQARGESTISAFFERYRSDGFSLNEHSAVGDELTRLNNQLNHGKNVRKSTRKALRNTFIRQFGLARGDGPEGILAWQKLSNCLGLPEHGTVEECKETIWRLSSAELVTLSKGWVIPGIRTAKPFIKAFFRPYHSQGFVYNPEVSVIDEFNRLCKELDFDKDARSDARGHLRRAYVDQFNANYGIDAENLVAWQDLCRDCELPIHNTLEQCRWAIKSAYINLVDLVDCVRPLTHFPTEKALSEYSLGEDKVFPRKDITRGSLLEALLRHILLSGAGLGYLGLRRGRGEKRR